MTLTKVQRQKIKEIGHKYGLNFILLFGSRVQGLTHQRSDFDLAYSAKESLNYRKEYELTCDLRQIFSLNPKIRIDLIDLDQASPLLAKEIAFNGQVLGEFTTHSFANFQMYAFKMFVEAKRLLFLRDQFITQNL